MKTSNAQRQAAYRTRHLKDVNGLAERLNVVLGLHAKLTLKRLSHCYCVTQRALLEHLLVNAEHALIDQLTAVPNGQQDYYDGLLQLPQAALRSNGHTSNPTNQESQ
jgi:hypothetical protein